MISILIPVLDDYNNLIKTIDSIERSLTLENIEIIIIDSSKIPIILPNICNNVHIIRQEKDIGPAQSRYLAAKIAKNDILFMADSHTFFPIGWDVELYDFLSNNKNKIGAFPVILSKTWEEKYFNFFPKYCGSNIYIKDFRSPNDFFDSHNVYTKKDIKLNAIKVAAYGIKKDYFLSLRGFEDIRQWGSDELCLSIKVLSTGGEINLLNKDFVHIFNKQILSRDFVSIYYNKLRLAQSFMDEGSYNYLMSILPKNNKILNEAWKLIIQDRDKIQEYRKFYKSIFTKDFKQLRKEYNIFE